MICHPRLLYFNKWSLVVKFLTGCAQTLKTVTENPAMTVRQTAQQGGRKLETIKKARGATRCQQSEWDPKKCPDKRQKRPSGNSEVKKEFAIQQQQGQIITNFNLEWIIWLHYRSMFYFNVYFFFFPIVSKWASLANKTFRSKWIHVSWGQIWAFRLTHLEIRLPLFFFHGTYNLG